MLFFIVVVINLCLNSLNIYTQLTNACYTQYYKYALLFEQYLLYLFWQDARSNVQFSALVQFVWEMPVPILFWVGCIVFKVSRSCQVTWCVWGHDLESRKHRIMSKEKQVLSDISVRAVLLQDLITQCCSSGIRRSYCKKWIVLFVKSS